MDISNKQKAETLFGEHVYNTIPYKYVNNHAFDRANLLSYCLGFEEIDINLRNEFINVLCDIYRIKIHNTPFLILLKEDIRNLISVYTPLNNYVEFVNSMHAYRYVINDITDGVSELLANHSLHIYGRFLARAINGIVTKNDIEIISVLANDKESIRRFQNDLIKKYSAFSCTVGDGYFVFIKGLKFILKFRYSKYNISDFINKYAIYDQIYVKHKNVKFTKKFYVYNNNVIDLKTYDYTQVYRMLNIYYTTSDNLKNHWNNIFQMQKDLMIMLTMLPSYSSGIIYNEHC